MRGITTNIKHYKVFLLFLMLMFFRIYSVCAVNFGEKLQLATARVECREAKLQIPYFSAINIDFTNFRQISASKIRKYIPSPHSEIVLGVVLGINDLTYIPTFNDILITTGTIHVVVVSGFNISLVFNIIVKLIGSQYKTKNLITALLLTLIYALISGFDPPVVRAWIMGLFAALGKFYGRTLGMISMLFFSAILMIILDPSYFISLSFQLSFLATLSLVLYSDIVLVIVKKVIRKKNFFFEDFVATCSAQVLVWPLISYKFERVSLISLVANTFTLWTIPLATILGSLFLVVSFLDSIYVIHLLLVYSKLLIIAPVDFFVKLCTLFSSFYYSTVDYKPSFTFMVVYYFVCLVLPISYSRQKDNKKKNYANT